MGTGYLTPVKNIAKVLFGGFGFLVIFYSIIDLTYFLSVPKDHQESFTPTEDVWVSTSRRALINVIVLCLFICQHSIVCLPPTKKLFKKYGLQDMHRVFYTITTGISLLVMMYNWKYIPELTLWKFNINFRPFWWIYTTIHIIAWLVIYVGNICMDVNELIGLKQIYYSIANLPDPNLRKSNDLQRLNSHMRHPSFLAFLLIFWTVPVMSFDRLLLATLFSLYMYFAWNTDNKDYEYQHSQYIRKFYELERINS